jgi:hypothetical protein
LLLVHRFNGLIDVKCLKLPLFDDLFVEVNFLDTEFKVLFVVKHSAGFEDLLFLLTCHWMLFNIRLLLIYTS